ncbi:iron donor protein CyaY [Rivihabitans pingtungensis]|jgi:CyaY protein|uniref:Iron-sulfur cluster assembly protein CyaY n=1 Tax=Rivihabitans pingtungensis TaxID=1054498 RepID=A0A318KCB0_9NEIS|nr:iron donor protein CyaY [Rivihabitans pingtungensis]MCK6436843.1 iron donor protein CyaY [Rivihabitans pingtungensis]PXX73981.1 iron donor protein CyaY [Rivihabitans pingtungensis]HNX71425.1 iron donor protein CyaY [Rivihabitans pingtungensis]
MTESEFLDLSDAVFERIQTALDEAGSDVEALLQGNVLTLDCESGGQVIVNRHVPNAEIWLAGKAGGFHFRLADDGRWVDTRDGGELFARLAELIQAQAGETIAF